MRTVFHADGGLSCSEDEEAPGRGGSFMQQLRVWTATSRDGCGLPPIVRPAHDRCSPTRMGEMPGPERGCQTICVWDDELNGHAKGLAWIVRHMCRTSKSARSLQAPVPPSPPHTAAAGRRVPHRAQTTRAVRSAGGGHTASPLRGAHRFLRRCAPFCPMLLRDTGNELRRFDCRGDADGAPVT